jgi:hypothetical protein
MRRFDLLSGKTIFVGSCITSFSLNDLREKVGVKLQVNLWT